MKLDQAVAIRDEIAALLLAKVEGSLDDEHEAVVMAARQLEQFGCMGGSTRQKAEAEIVRLVTRFDDTGESAFGAWPVTDFMQTKLAASDAYKAALERCIDAHKAGQYEPMVAAIESAENLMKDLSK